MSVDALFKQANAAVKAGNWAQAERQYRALTRIKPLWAHHNLGVLYANTGRSKEAEVAFRTALTADPTGAAPRHSLGMLLLRQGRYAEGWPLFEARRELPNLNIPQPRLGFPEWRGEDLTGKHLLVIREQGLGDQIMLARFLPELARRAAKLTFLCDPPLVTLFQSNGIDAVPAHEGETYPKADCWTLLFSVPLHLGTTLESLDDAPYLTASPIGDGGVGVKARGGPAHTNDRNRSLPTEAAAQLEALGKSLDPAATGAKDFLETAQIVAGLDLVISVDTSVAHLAAALGKPTWVLLSAIETDWRWLQIRADSPWYASVRLYRQRQLGKWSQVVRQATDDLRALRPAT